MDPVAVLDEFIENHKKIEQKYKDDMREVKNRLEAIRLEEQRLLRLKTEYEEQWKVEEASFNSTLQQVRDALNNAISAFDVIPSSNNNNSENGSSGPPRQRKRQRTTTGTTSSDALSTMDQNIKKFDEFNLPLLTNAEIRSGIARLSYTSAWIRKNCGFCKELSNQVRRGDLSGIDANARKSLSYVLHVHDTSSAASTSSNTGTPNNTSSTSTTASPPRRQFPVVQISSSDFSDNE